MNKLVKRPEIVDSKKTTGKTVFSCISASFYLFYPLFKTELFPMTTTTLPRVYITLMVVLFSFPLLNGCKEEPLLQITQPGILEVRMKTITTTYAPPSDTTRHAFGGNVNSLFAIRGDDTRMEVFADVRATDRSFFQIDLLAPRAWDSSMIIGQSYTPPERTNNLT